MRDYFFPSVHHRPEYLKKVIIFFFLLPLLFSIDNSSLPQTQKLWSCRCLSLDWFNLNELQLGHMLLMSCGTQALGLHSSQGFYQCWIKWKDDFTDFVDYTHLVCSRVLAPLAYDKTLWIYIWFAAHSIWRVLAVTSIVFPHPSFIRLFLSGSGSLHAPLPNCTALF